VARNTSMITTMLLFETGYRSNKMGDSNVLSVSFLLILQIYGCDDMHNKSSVFTVLRFCFYAVI